MFAMADSSSWAFRVQGEISSAKTLSARVDPTKDCARVYEEAKLFMELGPPKSKKDWRLGLEMGLLVDEVMAGERSGMEK